MKVLVYPKDPNPYQELLYQKLSNKVVFKYLLPPKYFRYIGIFFLPFQIVYYKIIGYEIFHLHWTYLFSIGKYSNFLSRLFFTIYFLYILILIKVIGYKLVWTVHNALPGDHRFLNETYIRNTFSKLCEAKIVHSETTIKQMRDLGINTTNSYIIPHGNYIDVYENNINRNDARKYLGYKTTDFIFLFFGLIERYKGVEDLLEAFKKICIKNKNAKLLIAGRCYDEDLNRKLNVFKNKYTNNVKIYNSFIENNFVQYYYNCADVVVYPVKEITTSGSVILAQSFGKPIICPNLGNLKDIPKNGVFLYEPNNITALYQAMKRAIKNRKFLVEMGESVFKYAQSFSWNRIADQTYEVYKTVTLR